MSEIGKLTKKRAGSGPESWSEDRWYQSNINNYPRTNEDFNDLPNLIQKDILPGSGPKSPILSKGDTIITLGSCFAAEMRFFLNDVGLSSDSFWVPSGLNNTFALLDFISWCVTGEQTSQGFRYERSGDGDIEDWKPKFERSKYLEYIRNAGAIVFTIGLAEVWTDRDSGGVFWRGIPSNIFDEKRHVFRVSTVEENQNNISKILELIRTINQSAPIIITLSPVPLKATFNDTSCIMSDCISKSILRVAISNALKNKDDNTYYFPSFEIVKYAGGHLPYPVYGTDDGVVRHVSRFIVQLILFEFIRSYYGEDILASIQSSYKSSLEEINGETGQPPKIWTGNIVTA